MPLLAAEIAGRVVDNEGQPLVGVSVVSDIGGLGTQSDSAGRFHLATSQEIKRVTFSCVGYQSRTFSAESVPPTVMLSAVFILGQDIIVSANRAQSGVTPIAFANFSQQEIKRDYTVGEFPLLLQSTPNLYSYSDGAGALGYSYMSIRGFDDKRIQTYINGVPLNDPEDQATYFVDLPDFASTVTDIQIQRGVGNALYGDASFGGSVNIATNDLSRERQVTFSSGFGQYTANDKAIGNLSKQTIEYSSGLIDGRWHFSGRFSRQKSDGYRYNSWYNGWAYYYAVARLDPNMTTELYVYGGPMKMHLSYWGSSREAIEQDRRSNPLGYDNETDNFNQPHYQLHNAYRLSDKATLSNTLYYIRGRGYYEQLKDAQEYWQYDIDTSLTDRDSAGAPFASGNLVRQQWVAKNQLGWNPRLDIDHAKGSHSLGGSFYYFDSEHWGQVVWAQHVGGALNPDHRYYEYHGKKWVGSLFAQEYYKLTDRLSSQLTAQLRYQRYKFSQERMGAFRGYQYDINWFFFSPRFGLNYRLTNEASLFANAAVSSRTPTDADIYDANDPTILPSLEIKSVSLAAGGDTAYVFGDPTAKNERLVNFELGSEFTKSTYSFGLNLFWMDFRNEILPYGGINPNTGLPITINADRSVHSGIEMTASAALTKGFRVSGNFAYNYNRVRKYSKAFYYDSDSVVVNFKDHKLSGFPEYLGNLLLDYERKWYRVTFRHRFVGRQWMELANIKSLSIAPYNTASLSATINWPNFVDAGTLSFSARVDNLFNTDYLAAGYGGNYAYDGGTGPVVDGWAEYFVGPERSFYLQIQLEAF
ncbi:MAG: TonB-dependent receptor [Candidatus Zixiibacteriota bacterium]